MSDLVPVKNIQDILCDVAEKTKNQINAKGVFIIAFDGNDNAVVGASFSDTISSEIIAEKIDILAKKFRREAPEKGKGFAA